MMNKRLILMVGVAGSGKSTNAKKFYTYMTDLGHTCAIISRDVIRFALLKDGEDYFSHEDDVWINFVNQAAESLRVNEITILDATHLTAAARKKIVDAVKKKYWDEDISLEAVVMDECVDTCLKNNANRVGRAHVPEATIWRMCEQLTIPTKAEGFNKVILTCWNPELEDYDVDMKWSEL